MKKYIVIGILLALGIFGTAYGASVLFPYQGGTGTPTAPSNGELLIGTSGGIYSVTTLTAGSNVTITEGSGSITIASTGGGGGSPGGTDGQLQYNNGGSFGGASALYYDDINDRVGIGESTPDALLEIVSDSINAPFMISDGAGGDGDIFIVDSSGNVSIGNLTQGSVPFIGASGLISEDNSNLVWNVGRTQLEANLIKIASDGTQAAPALKFNDTNTGFFKSGDSVRFSLNNSTKMTIDSTGVGIGDASPDAALEVTTSTQGSDYFYISTNAGNDGDIFKVDSNGDLSWGGTATGDVTGALTGNSSTATALATPRDIGGVSFNGTASIVPTTIVVADTEDATTLVGLWTDATGSLLPKTDEQLTYVANTGILTAGGFAGPLTGEITGNASTATALAGNPTDCGANTWTTSIVASGNLTCTAVTYAGITAMTSANWYGVISDETGSASGSPLLVFNTNPTLTGVTLAGIIADNDDMVFEVDANSDGANSFSWTDGGATEVMNLDESGNLQIDGTFAVDTIVGSSGNPVIVGDSQYDRLEMADNGATKTSIAQQNSNNFAIVTNGFFDGTWDNYDTSKHTLIQNFLITDPPYFAWSVAQPTAGAPSFTEIMKLTEAGNLQFDGTLTVGAVQWDNGSSLIDGEQIADNTIDVDSLDWGAFTDLGESGIVNWGNITAGELANNSIIDADIDDDGNFTFTGTWNFTSGDIVLPTTSVDAGTYAAASIDGDDINSNIAGRSLTLTAASPDTLDADPELYTDVKCIWIENPVATDDLKSIWTSNGFSTVITKIWCESDQADGPQLNLRIDDGAPAGVNGADLDCDNTPAEDENMEGDDTMADGDRLDLEITSVGGSETWLSVCWTLTRDD